MACGHPLAARAIRLVRGRLVTICWACEVERLVDQQESQAEAA